MEFVLIFVHQQPGGICNYYVPIHMNTLQADNKQTQPLCATSIDKEVANIDLLLLGSCWP